MLRDEKSYMRATAMLGFREFVDSLGGDGRALLRDAGLSETIDQDADALISYNRACYALELAAVRTGNSNFGMEWAQQMPDHFPNLGPLVMIAGFVHNLEEWIFTAIQYWKYHTNSFTVTLLPDENPDHVVIRLVVPDGISIPRQNTEHTFAVLVRVAQRTTGFTEERPSAMRFRHFAPYDTAAHARIFECPVEFGCEHDEVVFDRKYLSYPTAGNKALLKPLLDFYVRNRIRHMPIYERSMRTTVELAIPSIMGTGRCSIDFIAANLGLSRKSLQRALAKERTNFAEILEDIRRRTAFRLLGETRMPVARIAGLLDYSGPAQFILAFRRWADMTPLDFRRLRMEGAERPASPRPSRSAASA